MILIKETIVANEIFYNKIISDNGSIISKNEITYKTVTKNVNGKFVFLLYNSEMQPVSEVFCFLYRSVNADNSKDKALHALKFLYCFQSIIGKGLVDFNNNDITNLRSFLKGDSPCGQGLNFELVTSRSNQTINGYFSIFRQYLSYLGYENKFLSERHHLRFSVLSSNASQRNEYSYKTNAKIGRKPIEVPRYISVLEFESIVIEIRLHYGIMEEIIVRLMFQCGLRIGEVLGLTNEDLVVEKIDDFYCTVAYIRNRVSDRKDQCAKTCMKPTQVSQYKSRDYLLKGYGYQKIIVPIDLFDKINEYIETTHLREQVKHQIDYFKYSIADKVSENSSNVNFYIFLNSLGKPLVSQLWNIRLRRIFRSVGISLDKGTREHNLNHRFRHGFAMFNVQYLNCREIELMNRMRHRSLLSVVKYYNPTIHDIQKIKKEFSESLYELIPSLTSI